MNLGLCERTLKFRFCLQLCLGLRTPSLPPPFVLAFSTALLDGGASRAPTGVLPCARLGVSAPPTSAATPELEGYLLEKGRHGRSVFCGPGNLFRCILFYIPESLMYLFRLALPTLTTTPVRWARKRPITWNSSWNCRNATTPIFGSKSTTWYNYYWYCCCALKN